MSQRTTFYSPVTSTKVLAPPGGGNSEETSPVTPHRGLAPPGGRASIDLWGGYGNDDNKPTTRKSVVKEEMRQKVLETPTRKTRNILVSSPPGGASSISFG